MLSSGSTSPHDVAPTRQESPPSPSPTRWSEQAFYFDWTRQLGVEQYHAGMATEKNAGDLPKLFQPISLRGLTLKNRIVVSPMCQYSYEDGFPNDWTLVHLGQYALGGAGLIIAEAAGVEARGRITPYDIGIWKDEHIEKWKQVIAFGHAHGAAMAIQLAHAGRKASTSHPGTRSDRALSKEERGWETIAPSPLAFSETYAQPRELSIEEIGQVIESFAAAAKRAVEAGVDTVEIHGAHGYLIHEFLSPLSNQRNDKYGGSFENRIRFLVEIIHAIRAVIPNLMPLLLRLSCTDWAEEGWDIEQCIELAKVVREIGVDVIDCSSGGLTPAQKITVGPAYQVQFSKAIKEKLGDSIRTQAVGLLNYPDQVEEILQNGEADLIAMGREFLREPYWPLKAAQELGVDVHWPYQYQRAKPRSVPPGKSIVLPKSKV